MALTAEQITAGVNAALERVYPGIENGAQVALFAGSMQMMLLQGKRMTAEAEATIARTTANAAVSAADAVAREAQERANAAAAEFLAFVASLVQGG